MRAGRLRNPSFSFGRLRGGGVVEIERAVMFDVLGLLTMPLARQVEQRRFEQAQLQAAYEAVGVAAEARRAFFGAVAAQELVKLLRAGQGSRRRVERAGPAHGAGRQLQQAGADARAGVLRRRHGAAGPRAAPGRRRARAADARCSACPATSSASSCPSACRTCRSSRPSRRMPSRRRWTSAWTC